MKNFVLLLAVVALIACATPVSASIIGHISVANCPGGGVVVDATTIDWVNPAGPPDGCIASATGTAVSGTTTLGPGVIGSILDLTIGGGAVPGFMTFGAVTFTLEGFGPGVANLACPDSSAGPTCSVIAGSPFILAPSLGGTTIFLPAHGTVTDGSTPISKWNGVFSTSIGNQTPFAVQSTFFSAGVISSGFAGDFDLVPIPEPLTLGLIGGGLILLAMLRRRTVKG